MTCAKELGRWKGHQGNQSTQSPRVTEKLIGMGGPRGSQGRIMQGFPALGRDLHFIVCKMGQFEIVMSREGP